jgi:curved DNA-binding protein
VFVDHYEVLQISPNADQETVHRIYRVQAQRFHPDNQETGDAETFRLIAEAYQVLNDPQKRAAYDSEHREARRKEVWDSFEQSHSSQGRDAENRKREDIMRALYRKRLSNPDQPAMGLRELQDLLGVPREQLEFSLWYLKESGYLDRTDSARHSITIKGVQFAETLPDYRNVAPKVVSGVQMA